MTVRTQGQEASGCNRGFSAQLVLTRASKPVNPIARPQDHVTSEPGLQRSQNISGQSQPAESSHNNHNYERRIVIVIGVNRWRAHKTAQRNKRSGVTDVPRPALEVRFDISIASDLLL